MLFFLPQELFTSLAFREKSTAVNLAVSVIRQSKVLPSETAVELSRRLLRVPGACPEACLACEHWRALTAIQPSLAPDTSI